MPEFNLRDVVVDVLDSTDLADPSDVAEETFRRLTRGQYAEALRQSLRQTARLIMTGQRNHVSPPSGSSGSSGSPSRKVHAIREAWRDELMRARYQVGGQWKMLRELTRADLLAAVEERRQIAAANVAVAERLEKLAAALPDDEATVDVLDDDVLRDAFGRDAA